MAAETERPLTEAEFIERLRSVGARRYHDKHPFQRAMNAGVLTREQMRGWVANRYYYQKCIPIKDAAILSNLPDREKRRLWITRITDQDGTLEHGGGGMDSWIALARAVGLKEDELSDERHVQPGTHVAADAYVTFARTQPWLIAVASSLTELFAPELMSARIAALLEKYPWIDPSGLAYFRNRLTLASRDAEYALCWVVAGATSAELQSACTHALEFKCDVLWAMLDAIQQAYGVGDGRVPS